MSTPKLPKPFVPKSPEQQLVYDLFKKLPYNEQANVFRNMSILFDEIMEVQRFAQHQKKIDAVVIENIEPGLHRLTNVHGHVYMARYDVDGYEKYGSEGHLFWQENDERNTYYLKGGLEKVIQRICNL